MTTEAFIPYKFIKLISGEDIVCMVEEDDSSKNQIKIIHPLKMQMLPRMLTGAQNDSIGLSQWISPMTEEKTFQISLKNILLISDASPGLIKYYEYVLTQMDNNLIDLANIDDDDDNDNDDDELINILPEPSKLIH